MSSKYSTVACNAAIAALGALCNGGKLRIYDGAQPADANTAITTQNLLAEFTLPNPAFGSAGSGIVTANAISPVSVLRAGTAAWCRIVESDGATGVMDGTVGVSNANVVLNSVALTVPSQIAITSLSLTEISTGT